MTATRTTDRPATVRTLAVWTRDLARVVLVTAMIAALTGVGVMTTAAPAGAAGGELLSVATFGGTGSDEGRAVAVDAAGNVYTTGLFQGTVDFDPGPGIDTRISAGGLDMFVTKLDPTGAHQWTATIGGTGVDVAEGIAVDTAGNVYAAGSFQDTVDFDPGAGITNRTSVGGFDVFVTKLSAAGAHQWTATFGGTGDDQGSGVAVDGAGNVHTTGYFQGMVDFDPGAGITNRTSAGGFDVFVTKLSAAGAHQWTATFGASGTEEGFAVAVDVAGNVHTTGYFEGTVDFDPGAGIDTRTSAGGSDVFVTKMSAAGTYQWTATYGGTSFDLGLGIALDAVGNVHTTGAFRGTVDFDPGAGTDDRTAVGGTDVFVTKLSSAGAHQWATTFGGTSSDFGARVAIDGAGNVHATGYFEGTVDFDPGAGIDTRTSAGHLDVFVTRLSPGGAHQWAATFGGTSSDFGTGVAVDAAGDVHTTGYFEGTVDFDPGAGITNRTAAGSGDVFVVELAAKGVCDGLPVTVDIAAGDTPTAGDDVILGTAGNDVISAGAGNDIICGGGGDDTISGGAGDDTIYGGDGNDTIFGSDGNDTIDAGNDNDIVQGNNGDDTIIGGAGTDTLSGNDGNDGIDGGGQNDTIYGGAGSDVIVGGGAADTILGGLGHDVIEGSGDSDLISGNAGDDIILGGDDNDTLYGADGDDSIRGGNADDIILGGNGNDVIDGEGGVDRLAGNAGDDEVYGGNDDDELYGGNDSDTLDAGPGNDLALGGLGNDTVNGGAGNDVLSGNEADDIVNGGDGNDEIYGADGNDTLDGGTGNDIILGGNDNDTIDSFDFEVDQVSGNAGTDTCTRDLFDNVFACENLIP